MARVRATGGCPRNIFSPVVWGGNTTACYNESVRAIVRILGFVFIPAATAALFIGIFFLVRWCVSVILP